MVAGTVTTRVSGRRAEAYWSCSGDAVKQRRMKEKSGPNTGDSFAVVGSRWSALRTRVSGRRAEAYWSCGGVERERPSFGKKSCVRREVEILI